MLIAPATLRLGSTTPTRAYLGATEVWSATPPETPTGLAFVDGKGHARWAAANIVPALRGVQAGDVLIAWATGNSSSTTLTPPAGLTWTVLGESVTNPRGRVLTAVATGAFAASTWTWEAAFNHAVIVAAYRGAAVPTTATVPGADQSIVTTKDAPSQTTTVANSLLICMGFHSSNGGTSREFPVSMTKRVDTSTTTPVEILAEELIPTASVTGTRTYTIVPGTGALSVASLVLAPA